jgi:hypothetical protein
MTESAYQHALMCKPGLYACQTRRRLDTQWLKEMKKKSQMDNARDYDQRFLKCMNEDFFTFRSNEDKRDMIKLLKKYKPLVERVGLLNYMLMISE